LRSPQNYEWILLYISDREPVKKKIVISPAGNQISASQLSPWHVIRALRRRDRNLEPGNSCGYGKLETGKDF